MEADLLHDIRNIRASESEILQGTSQAAIVSRITEKITIRG